MRAARDLLLDQALQRRAGGLLWRSAAYVLVGGLALITASASSLVVDGTTAKLLVWAATLVVLLLLWGAGVWAWETFKVRRSAASATTRYPPARMHHRPAGILPDRTPGQSTTFPKGATGCVRNS